MKARVREQVVSPHKARTDIESPRKGSDRHPIYLLHLRMPSSLVDIGLEPTKRVVLFQARLHYYSGKC